jgi:hypothetical protein
LGLFEKNIFFQKVPKIEEYKITDYANRNTFTPGYALKRMDIKREHSPYEEEFYFDTFSAAMTLMVLSAECTNNIHPSLAQIVSNYLYNSYVKAEENFTRNNPTELDKEITEMNAKRVQFIGDKFVDLITNCHTSIRPTVIKFLLPHLHFNKNFGINIECSLLFPEENFDGTLKPDHMENIQVNKTVNDDLMNQYENKFKNQCKIIHETILVNKLVSKIIDDTDSEASTMDSYRSNENEEDFPSDLKNQTLFKIFNF